MEAVADFSRLGEKRSRRSRAVDKDDFALLSLFTRFGSPEVCMRSIRAVLMTVEGVRCGMFGMRIRFRL